MIFRVQLFKPIVCVFSRCSPPCTCLLFWLSSTVPGYPKVQCDRIPCPDPYMGLGVQPGAPPDRSLPAQDPIGAGECLCWSSCCRVLPYGIDIVAGVALMRFMITSVTSCVPTDYITNAFRQYFTTGTLQ
jgi:hypothetical protein